MTNKEAEGLLAINARLTAEVGRHYTRLGNILDE
jgi:hypothetical protein